MENLVGYFKSKYKEIKKNYFGQSCSLIARNIAILLLESGEKPFIIQFMNGDGTQLNPKMYNLGWDMHIVCCSNKFAYDPILSKPIEIKKYSKKVFGEEINFKVIFSESEIKNFIQ